MNAFQKIISVLVLVVLCCFGGTSIEAAETENTYYLLDSNEISDELNANARVVAKIRTGVAKEQLRSQITYVSGEDTVEVGGLNATAFSSYCSRFYIKSDSNIGTFSPKAKITIDGEVGKKVVYQEIQNAAKISCAGRVYLDESSKNIYVNSMGISGTNVIYAAGNGNATVLTVNSTNKNDTISWLANSNSVQFNVTTTSSDNGQVQVKSVAHPTTNEKVTITATASDGSSTSFDLQIVPATILLNKTELNLYTCGSETTGVLNAVVNGVEGNVVWQSSDPNCVQVSANGTVTALKEGGVTVTATANGVSAACRVTVKTPVFSLNTTSATIYHEIQNKTVQLSASLNGVQLSSGVTWSSNKPDIAKVDANGKVTGQKKGKATITASYAGGVVIQKCSIDVNDSTIKIKDFSVKKGQQTDPIVVTINGTVYKDTKDKNGDYHLEWSSQNEDIAKVGKAGRVTGKKADASTKITVKYKDKSLSDTCTVKVTK